MWGSKTFGRQRPMQLIILCNVFKWLPGGGAASSGHAGSPTHLNDCRRHPWVWICVYLEQESGTVLYNSMSLIYCLEMLVTLQMKEVRSIMESHQFTSLIWKVIDDFKTQYYQTVVALGSDKSSFPPFDATLGTTAIVSSQASKKNK